MTSSLVTRSLVGAALALAGLTAPLRGAAQESAARADERAQPPARVEDHFRVCDLDENGWVSYREANLALGVDKSEYRAFDRDHDGRLDLDEFRTRYERMLELLGAAPDPDADALLRERDPTTELAGAEPLPALPTPEVRRTEPSFPRPEDLLRTFDRDESGGLALEEVAEAIRRAGMLLSAEVVLTQTDKDHSDALELAELAPLATLLADHLPWTSRSPGGAGPVERPGAGARRTPRAVERAAPAPRTRDPRLPMAPYEHSLEPTPAEVTPVSVGHFRLLDVDRDGLVTRDDLEALVSPARSSLRPAAVLAALDRNGDGALDPAEFRAALGAD